MKRTLLRRNYFSWHDQFWWAALEHAAARLFNRRIQFVGVEFDPDEPAEGRPIAFVGQVYEPVPKRAPDAATSERIIVN